MRPGFDQHTALENAEAQLRLLARLHRLEVVPTYSGDIHDISHAGFKVRMGKDNQPEKLVFTMDRGEMPTTHILTSIGDMCEPLVKAKLIDATETLYRADTIPAGTHPELDGRPVQTIAHLGELQNPDKQGFQAKEGSVTYTNRGKDGIEVTFDIMPSDTSAYTRIAQATQFALEESAVGVGLQAKVTNPSAPGTWLGRFASYKAGY